MYLRDPQRVRPGECGDMMEDRLSRLEDKIDLLQDAVVKLAKVEERIVTVFNRQSDIDRKVDRIESEVRDLSIKMSGKYPERIFWILFATIAAALSNYF